MYRTKEDILDDQHWRFANYRQRMTIKDWRELLLNDDDKIHFGGKVVRLSAKALGAGVVEVYKALNDTQ